MRNISNKVFKPKQKFSKQILLVIPFILLSLLLVITPMIMILIKSFLPTESGSSTLNWSYMDGFVWGKILLSIILAIIATFLCVLIAYPFSYFLSFGSSKLFKTIVVIIITAPIWTSFLVKLIGLKTFFDICAGYNNSTYGHIWTVIGMTYIYLPFMILPLYNTLEDMPKNLIYASKDLGQNGLKTFFKVVLPYTKLALLSGLTLVFLPCVTTVAIPQFMNNAPNGATIGDIIVQEGEQAATSEIALARASTLSLVVSIIMLALYGLIALTPKVFKWFKEKKVSKNIIANEKPKGAKHD